MTPTVLTAGGNLIRLPDTDPVVASHLANDKALVPLLLDQVNAQKIYEDVFHGARDWVMLDIGANIGIVSLHASDVCERIIALEPSPQFEVLRRLCAPFPQIACLKTALAAHNGSVEFLLNDVNPTASSMDQTYGQPIVVPTITLRRLISAHKLQRVDLCKVDIEGTETDCLTPSAVGALRPIIRAYYVEVHNCPNSTWETKLGRLVATFAHAGYKRMRVLGDALFSAVE